jgi:hypothetical protein
MKKRVLRELGKIFTHETKVESVENPVEKVFNEVIDEIVKPKKTKKKEA